MKNIPDINNDTIKKIRNSIDLNERAIKGVITPPENQATLIFPIISEARFS